MSSPPTKADASLGDRTSSSSSKADGSNIIPSDPIHSHEQHYQFSKSPEVHQSETIQHSENLKGQLNASSFCFNLLYEETGKIEGNEGGKERIKVVESSENESSLEIEMEMGIEDINEEEKRKLLLNTDSSFQLHLFSSMIPPPHSPEFSMLDSQSWVNVSSSSSPTLLSMAEPSTLLPTPSLASVAPTSSPHSISTPTSFSPTFPPSFPTPASSLPRSSPHASIRSRRSRRRVLRAKPAPSSVPPSRHWPSPWFAFLSVALMGVSFGAGIWFASWRRPIPPPPPPPPPPSFYPLFTDVFFTHAGGWLSTEWGVVRDFWCRWWPTLF